GARSVVGVDPGLRTGCKCTAVDPTGKVLGTLTIYPGQGKGKDEGARRELAAFLAAHAPDVIAVGNGTGGREAEAFVREVLVAMEAREVPVVLVSEAGASVYSASEVARDELPGLDVTLRGA